VYEPNLSLLGVKVEEEEEEEEEVISKTYLPQAVDQPLYP
jgi:hypothetical protein